MKFLCPACDDEVSIEEEKCFGCQLSTHDYCLEVVGRYRYCSVCAKKKLATKGGSGDE